MSNRTGSAGEGARRAAPPTESRVLPVTLVVPVRDEEATVGALMDSVEAQTAPPAQVIFVDAGSTDRTAEIVRDRSGRDDRYVVVEAGGVATPGRARNVGVAAAMHEWVAMTDAGITLDSTWLERLWDAHLRDKRAEVVFGSYEFDLRSSYEECAAIAYGVPKRQTPGGVCRGAQVVSCLIHRQAFFTVGGFRNLRAGEDELFVSALESSGIRSTWAPEAIVRWRLRPDLRSTFERFRLYSFHYSLAGGKEHWHHPLRRNYQPVALGLLLSAVHSRRWLLLAGGTLGSRVASRLKRHHPDRAWGWLLRPDRVALVAIIVVTSDAATFLGWWQAVNAAGQERPGSP